MGWRPELEHIAGEHDHPFFVGTLYQPQLRSAPGLSHPVFIGLLDAAHATR